MVHVTTAAEIARAVNERICSLAEHLDGGKRDGHTYDFLCEDGCGATVTTTLGDYLAAGGAWLDGHSPEEHQRDRGVGRLSVR